MSEFHAILYSLEAVIGSMYGCVEIVLAKFINQT
jgi:hypothetical protein